MDRLLTMVAENITRASGNIWEMVNGVVVRVYVPSVTLAPTAPAVPAAPASIPEPAPILAIILSLVVTSIVAGIVVWYFGFRDGK